MRASFRFQPGKLPRLWTYTFILLVALICAPVDEIGPLFICLLALCFSLLWNYCSCFCSLFFLGLHVILYLYVWSVCSNPLPFFFPFGLVIFLLISRSSSFLCSYQVLCDWNIFCFLKLFWKMFWYIEISYFNIAEFIYFFFFYGSCL